MITTLGELKSPIKIHLEVMKPFEFGVKATIQTAPKSVLMKKERVPIKALSPIQERYMVIKLNELVDDEWRVIAYKSKPNNSPSRLNTNGLWKYWMTWGDVLDFRKLLDERKALIVQKIYPDRAMLLAKLAREKQ